MKVEQIEVPLTDPPAPFSQASFNLKRAEDVLQITNSLRGFWPLTVRSIYYKIISSPMYSEDHWRTHDRWGNCRGKDLSQPEQQVGDCLKYLRLGYELPMNAINDDSRIVTIKLGGTDFEGHVTDHLDSIGIPHFNRCNADQQEKYIEVWVEKNGLVHIAESVADEFCRRTVGCKGFGSVTMLAGYADRVLRNVGEPVILYFGDCDPSGWLIPKTIKSSLEFEHDVEVEVIRCGLNPQNIKPGMVSIPLEGSKPVKGVFRAETGLNVGYELDLLDPNVFQGMIRESLESHTDMEVRDIAVGQGERDNEKIDEMNEIIENALDDVSDELDEYL